jgi:hypothetical protein
VVEEIEENKVDHYKKVIDLRDEAVHEELQQENLEEE